MVTLIVVGTLVVVLALVAVGSLHLIGPTEVGLVTKRFGRRLATGQVIAFGGEAGYQAELLMPGLRWKTWPIFSVSREDVVQVPAGEIGLVIAQVGAPLPVGAKTATVPPGVPAGTAVDYANVRAFIEAGGQRGVQRVVLPPGTVAPIHPVGFLVFTASGYFGLKIDDDVSLAALGLTDDTLRVRRIAPPREGGDVVGIVTTHDGPPPEGGAIASRLGGFVDADAAASDAERIERLLGSRNEAHAAFQDFDAFLAAGGRMGLQHDVLLYGAYNLNPVLVSVEPTPMLVVEQGQVAVIKSYIGLPTEDVSGEDFKYGVLVQPGHRGIWSEPLRTGKYALNPRCYRSEIVPTAILTLNWAANVSAAHQLDRHLSPIEAKSREGFVFVIDLQVQIHVADTKAPRVIARVGSVGNLVNEVLQAAVGNYFRDTLQGLKAIEFIERRAQVQAQAQEYITEQLAKYEVETLGVYIQDVRLPEDLVRVLQQREIAAQQVATFTQERLAQEERVKTEQVRGTADAQKDLARAQVGVEIAERKAAARVAEADGQAAFVEKTGTAAGAEVRAIAVARADGYQRQVAALGQTATAIVNVVGALADVKQRFVPDVLVVGGDGAGLDGLVATLIRRILGTAENVGGGG